MKKCAYNIAVTGLALKFPKTHTADELWQNLTKGRDCISRRSSHPSKEGRIFAYGAVDGVYDFDSRFFDISETEALKMAQIGRAHV